MVCDQLLQVMNKRGTNTIGLMHDDVLLIKFTTKPRIQNAMFPKG